MHFTISLLLWFVIFSFITALPAPAETVAVNSGKHGAVSLRDMIKEDESPSVDDTEPPFTSADPSGGLFNSVQVILNCDDGSGSGCAATYYTADQTEPTTASSLYSRAIPIKMDTTLKFFSVDKAGNPGEVQTEVYTIDPDSPSSSADPAGGFYSPSQEVILTCDDAAGSGCAAICYTTDGTEPTADSALYSEPIIINENTTLKFFSTDHAGNAEEVKTEAYIIDVEPPEIHISHPKDGAILNHLNSIEGIALDTGSGVSELEFQIIDKAWFWFLTALNDSEQQVYTFTTNEAWIPAIGRDSWSFDTTGVYWRDYPPTAYTITVRTADALGNSVSASVEVILDRSIPDPIPSAITCELSGEGEFILGEPLRISGEISPVPPDQIAVFVNIAITPPDGQNEISKPVLANKEGEFSYDLDCADITTDGLWKIQTSWAGSGEIENAASDVRTIEVSKAGTRVTLDVTSRAIKVGDKVTFSGKYTPQPDCGRDLSGISVKLNISGPEDISDEILTETNDRWGHFLQDYNGFNALGEWTITAVSEGNDAYNSAESEPIRVRVVEMAGYAVIVQGRHSNGEGLASHRKTTDFVYDTLRDRYFFDDEDHNDIMYLNDDVTHPKTDGVPSKAAVKDALTQWARDKMNEKPSNLYIVMVDHGLEDTFFIHPDEISSKELGEWLDTLQESLTDQAKEQEIVVVLGFCHSGSFIDALSGERRVIITSSASDESSYKGPLDEDGIREGEYFVSKFFQAASFGKSVKRCFQDAADMTVSFTASLGSDMSVNSSYLDSSPQHPLLDDNGNGKGNFDLSGTEGDGEVSEDIFVGISTLTVNDPGDVSVIRVAPTTFLGEYGDSANLWACVDNRTRLKTIWVEIKQPGYNSIGLSGWGQAEVNLPSSPGVYNMMTDRYEWNDLEGFEEPGTYQVFYFAKDQITGNVSPLMETRVYKERWGNQPPEPFFPLSPGDEENVMTPILKLDWTDSRDPDQDRITYTVILSEDEQFFGNRIEKEDVRCSASLVSPLDGISDSGYYFWKVQAVDECGAVWETSVRSFYLHNTNPVESWIGGNVYDAASHRPVMGAVMNILGAGGSVLNALQTDAMGCYLEPVSDEADTITVEPMGYVPASRSWSLGNIFGRNQGRKASRSEEYVVKQNFGFELVGDIRRDGVIDLKDAVLALQVLAGMPSSEINVEVALNGGKIGFADVIYALQSVSGIR